MQTQGRHLDCLHISCFQTSQPEQIKPSKKEKRPENNKKFIVFHLSCRASTLSSAVSSLSSTGMSFSRMDEKEKQQALEEEQARLQALKVTCNTFIPNIVWTGGSDSAAVHWCHLYPAPLTQTQAVLIQTVTRFKGTYFTWFYRIILWIFLVSWGLSWWDESLSTLLVLFFRLGGTSSI